MKRLTLFSLLFAFATGAFAQSKPVRTVTDADIVGDMAWSADTVYVLNGYVFVEDGESLTIPAGTVIKAESGQGSDASALVVAQGGMINAVGTASEPIIFTSSSDDVDDPNDVPSDARGLWGGVILLGKAQINTADSVGQIEGIPTTEPRGAYGGQDDEDNSGTMKYVSIRYGGTDIGEGNEINGLTFGAVGSGTTIEHIEVFNNKDDGFEWFGGTVNTKWLVAAFCGDDAFDYDEGFRGKGQFWFTIISDENGIGNRAGEHDGGTTPEDGTPYANPQIYNVTYIGSGMNSANVENDLVFKIRDNAGGGYYNSIFTDFNNEAIDVEDLESGEDSRARLEAGDLVLTNNLWYGFGAGSTWTELAAQDFVQTYMSDAANANTIADPMLRGVSRTNDAGLDPRLASASPALTSAMATIPDDGFYSQVTYLGAFDNQNNWLAGWTSLSTLGYLSPVTSEEGKPQRNITDTDIVGDMVWSADTVYVLNGYVFVEDGESLTIPAGTIIKAESGQGSDASALVVARGGMINAVGTASEPIIFTASTDNVDDPDDVPSDARGLWGGVILLGKAQINTADSVGQIEGIPTTEPRGAYGGQDDEDNSGTMKYVSIRYGGTDIGEGNEINGLTFGAVGSGTTIEHIEVFNNKDDGFEWFGGTVNTKWLVAAFCGDDAFDYDEGFRGKGQFWFTIISDENGIGNRAGEHDGGTTPEDGTPYANPQIYNVTYIGSGMNSANVENDLVFKIRDNAGGGYYNSIFTDFNNEAIDVEDLESGEDSRARLEAGDLVLTNNLWYGFGAGSTWAELAAQDFVQTYMSDAANANTIADPRLRGVSRSADAGLDPRLTSNSPALSGGVTVPDDGFYSQVSYLGAFDNQSNWATGWTALDGYGYFGDLADDTTSTGGEGERIITDADIVGDMTWSADTVYVLNGYVFVEDGESLTIPAGTVIKAESGQGSDASALIVAQGGMINAVGTAANPIIFTSVNDDVTDPDDVPSDARGLWGGVILLGKAQINTADSVGQIEGIPTTEPRGAYGGQDDEDNSGTMKYVSIRYGGTDIGEGNEINGLTFGAVGSGTTIEHIEVFNNKDDGFEWFGGTVNTKWLIAAFCGDDAFDYDEGFRGKGQFWFTIISDENGIGNRAGEHDGGTTPEDGTPYANPQIYNVTYIGSGMNSANVENDLVFKIRDNAGGGYYNSIFTDFNNEAIDVEDLESGEDSRARLEAGDLVLTNNLWYGFGAGSTWAELAAQDFVQSYMSDAANANTIADPRLRGVSRSADAGLDPRLTSNSPALSGGVTVPDDGFYSQVSYLGAFDNQSNWATGWTALDGYGYFGDLADDTTSTGGEGERIITDADIVGDMTWSADTVYVLSGYVFVEDGESLTIPAGTVIKAESGQGSDASALIVAQGGMINAVGTAANPIIFTSVNDDVTDPDDIPSDARGLWGGVILLGKAQINTADSVGQIEGIPTTEPRGAYGGQDDEDNSGTMKYISIRYGGTDIGEGNEINGLTFGAVGSGTTIEHIEVFNNKDDGFEWFGGTVNTKWLVAAYCGDDCFDYDEGFRGMGQFWFAIQDDENGIGNRGGEHDGGTTPEDGLPYAIPQIYNVTYIGAGATSDNVENDLTFMFRDNAGGMYYNSIFTDFNNEAISVEDLDSGEDSRARLEGGDLMLVNNLWYGFGAGSTWAELAAQDFVQTYMSDPDNMNEIVDPMLRGVSRTADGQLDPRPMNASPALTGASGVPENLFFDQTAFRGAFSNGDSWLTGWTALDMLGFLGDLDGGPIGDDSTLTCDLNGDGNSTISDVVTMILLSRSNPTDLRLDFNRSGAYTIADPVALLKAMREGTCPTGSLLFLASASSTGGGLFEVSRIEGMTEDEIAYVEENLARMDLTEEDVAAFRLALYGESGRASLPKAFALSQNAPNPFNPSTTISYQVPDGQSSMVKLNIYDISGRLVATLVDEVREAGTYTVFWDGTDRNGRQVSSGVYFYRMVSGDYAQTRKMVLLK